VLKNGYYELIQNHYWAIVGISSDSICATAPNFWYSHLIPPEGWQSETKDFATSYLQTNSATGGWCRITLYKSLTGSGDAVTDFHDEWNTLVVKSFPDVLQPTLHLDEEDGW